MPKEERIIKITEDEIKADSDRDMVTIKSKDLIGNTNNTDGTDKPQPLPWSPPISSSYQKEAANLVLLIDTSGSMGAADYQPNRLEAAKKAAKMFTQ